MANLLKPRQAKSDPSYEGFDMSHKLNFTSSCGHIIPVYYDLLLPGDKIDIRCQMLSIIPQLVAPSPIILDENVDYYFIPLECLYDLFPALLSDTNEDVTSALYNSSNFKDAIPLFQTRRFLDTVNFVDEKTVKDGFLFDWYRRGAMRLADAFRTIGYIYPFQHPTPMPGSATSVGLNCLTLLAYQCVWQYYYRDDKRMSFDNKAFNVSDFYAQAGTAIYDYNRMKRFFEIKYHPWRKDPYMILSPSPLAGQATVNHFADYNNSDNRFSSFVQQWLSDNNNIFVANVSNKTGYTESGVGNVGVNSATDVAFSNKTTEFDDRQSLQQHRIAQAIERLSAIWMQSGKSYKEMMGNLFGVKVHTPTDRPSYLGSDSNKIYINEVVANVETAQTEIGQMTGYGNGNNTQEVLDKKYESTKFTAPCHGIILGLYSAVPDAYYTSLGIDPINTYQKRNSFPWPQTDELGEQPLFGYEFMFFGDPGGVNAASEAFRIYGWLPRFHELKLKPNLAIFGFAPGSSLSYWIPKRQMSNLEGTFTFDWTDFYVDPNYLNSILVNSYGNISDPDFGVDAYYKMDYYSSDPILHFFKFHSHKASKMSSYGVPKTYFG